MSIIFHTFVNSVVGIAVGFALGYAIVMSMIFNTKAGKFVINDYKKYRNMEVFRHNLSLFFSLYNCRALLISITFAGWIIFVGRGIL